MAFWFYLKDEDDASFLFDSIDSWRDENLENYIIGIKDFKQQIEIKLDHPPQFDDDFEII